MMGHQCYDIAKQTADRVAHYDKLKKVAEGNQIEFIRTDDEIYITDGGMREITQRRCSEGIPDKMEDDEIFELRVIELFKKLEKRTCPSIPPDRHTREDNGGNNGEALKALQEDERDKRLYELACDKQKYPAWDDVITAYNEEFSDHQIDISTVQETAKCYAKKKRLGRAT